MNFQRSFFILDLRFFMVFPFIPVIFCFFAWCLVFYIWCGCFLCGMECASSVDSFQVTSFRLVVCLCCNFQHPSSVCQQPSLLLFFSFKVQSANWSPHLVWDSICLTCASRIYAIFWSSRSLTSRLLGSLKININLIFLYCMNNEFFNKFKVSHICLLFITYLYLSLSPCRFTPLFFLPSHLFISITVNLWFWVFFRNILSSVKVEMLHLNLILWTNIW